MSTALGALLAKFAPYIIAFFAALGVFLGYGARQKTKGKLEERADQKEKDREKADAIRDRVERDLPDRVREFDDRGYRD